jgi:hypothetical protein
MSSSDCSLLTRNLDGSFRLNIYQCSHFRRYPQILPHNPLARDLPQTDSLSIQYLVNVDKSPPPNRVWARSLSPTFFSKNVRHGAIRVDLRVSAAIHVRLNRQPIADSSGRTWHDRSSSRAMARGLGEKGRNQFGPKACTNTHRCPPVLSRSRGLGNFL